MRHVGTGSLALAALLHACAPGGPPLHASGELIATGDAMPDGYLEDVRGELPLVAMRNEAGETELHGLSGLVAPPIPGHERAELRALRSSPDGSIWVCHDEGIARFFESTWTHHDFVSFEAVGPCTSLDARAADDVYAGVGTDICAWDGTFWDCFAFGPTRAITLSPGHLWFVRASAHYDDLTVIDTISRATPGLVRLGDAGSTEALLPVPATEEVLVTSNASGLRTFRSATPEGAFTTLDANTVIPTGPHERYLLRVGPEASVCEGLICARGAEWSELVVLHATADATREVGHLTTVGPAGVPWRGFLVDGALRVRAESGLLALP